MKLRSRRGMIVMGAALLLVLFLVRPGAARLKTRIASSIGMALQRQVEIGGVHLRLLPQPGFDLENFVVHDDPSFGAEPLLRSQEVTAFLRVSALLRGHLEISHLNLTEPSLNLVRTDDGHWNLEKLLERTASIAVAPTGKAPSVSRPSFPYIEADRGRINFKFGPEKKPFAVTDATYAFWQDSENTWGMRLKGQPVRTDFSVSDTGQLRMNGTWTRAPALSQTPIQFDLRWDEVQLGQFTKLLSGSDKGWRGTVSLSVNCSGTPADLAVRADASLLDFRRYDLPESSRLELKTHCEGRYSAADRSLRQALCQSPVGEGRLTLTGNAAAVSAPARYDAQLTADHVPLSAVLAVIRRAKKELPSDLQAAGTLDAEFDLHSNFPGSPALEGNGHTDGFRLQSTANKIDLPLDTVPFVFTSGPQTNVPTKKHSVRDAHVLHPPDEPRLEIGPFPLKLGRPAPVAVQGWLAHSGYTFSIAGDADLVRLLSVARLAGIPAANTTAVGSAKVDLQVAGVWSGFPSPATTGVAELRQVRAEFRGLNGPVEIASANLTLGTEDTRVDSLSASVAGSEWKGSLTIPRGCPGNTACRAAFDLHAVEISTDVLNEWLNPHPPKRPWYRFPSGAPQTGPPLLASLRAAGAVSVDRFTLRDLSGEHCAAKVELDRGKVRISDLRAEVLGGKHWGEWRADFTARPPIYSGSGTLEGASLLRLADLMRDHWISGTANAKYQLELSGYSAAELSASAKGTLQFEARDGILSHLVVGSAPLRVRRFAGVLALHEGEFELQQAKVDSPAGSYEVTGKASMSRHLDLKLVQAGAAALTVSGTLSDPHVTAVRHAETQAALKP